MMSAWFVASISDEQSFWANSGLVLLAGLLAILIFRQQPQSLLKNDTLRLTLVWMLSVALFGVVFRWSVQHVVYFILNTWIIGVVMIWVPRRWHEEVPMRQSLAELRQQHHLIRLWLRYRIEDRYSQTFLGILWIVLLPLSTSLVLAFAFDQLMGVRTGADGVSSLSFLLSGIVIFGVFRDLILKAKGALLSAKGVISQVYFPREILIVLVLGETLIDFVFVFFAMVVINSMHGLYPNGYYVWLPIPLLILVMLTTGTAFFLSWLSLKIRDLQQLITVVMQLLFYLMVLYSPQRAAGDYDMLLKMIPLTSIIGVFRDIVLFGRNPDWVSLYYPFIVGCVLMYVGYSYFKAHEDRIMDFF